jgi:hypothetical protein
MTNNVDEFAVIEEKDYADGSKLAKLRNGLKFIFDGKGGIECELPSGFTVVIANPDEVESHTINSIVGSHSHVVHFINGGLLLLAYNDAGDLIDFSPQKLGIRITQDMYLS